MSSTLFGKSRIRTICEEPLRQHPFQGKSIDFHGFGFKLEAFEFPVTCQAIHTLSHVRFLRGIMELFHWKEPNVIPSSRSLVPEKMSAMLKIFLRS